MTSPATPPALSVRDIRKRFGSVEVLHGIDLDVRAGEVVAIVGENGAGKSTLAGIIAGATRWTSGRMELFGRPYAPANPRQALDAGVGLIHQELWLLPHLSIAENVFVGRWPARSGRVDHTAMVEQAQTLIDALGLNVPASRNVDGLSTAEQQLVEIARALALEGRLLILDEPTAALGGAEVDRLFDRIAQLKSAGVAIIYVSHRLEEIRRVADRIVVLRDGEKVATFDRGDVPVRSLVEAMVGRSFDRLFPPVPEPNDDVLLEVEHLSAADGGFEDVGFRVRAGEILGIAGLVGAGRTAIVRAMAGVDPIGAGRVRLRGKDVTPRRPSDAIRQGIVLVPEDRKLQGLVLEHSLAENVGYANLDAVSERGFVPARRLAEFARTHLDRFGVKGRWDQPADELSGGNQQKVVLAKWVARAPDVVLLDEPTRGIDVGARFAIYEMIVQLAAAGKAIVMVSSDLEEVLGLSHHVLILSRGRQTGLLTRSEANEVAVMELATA